MFQKFFQKHFVAQGIIEVNISWPSNFVDKYFIVQHINFSFLSKACLYKYFKVVFTVIFKSQKELIFAIIFKEILQKMSNISFAISKFFYKRIKIKKISRKFIIGSSTIQSVELSSLSKNYNIIEEGKVIFRKKILTLFFGARLLLSHVV